MYLQKINSDSRRRNFKYDVARGGKMTIETVEDEAMAGIACEDQKVTQRTFTRSLRAEEEFIDDLGQAWDVKTAKSYSMSGKYIFDVNNFVNSIVKEYPCGERIIINITPLKDSDLEILYTELKKRLTKKEIEMTMIIDVEKPSRSQSTNALFKLLDK